LVRSIRVDPAGAIPAEGRARLGKASDGFPAPRKRDRKPEALQLLGIITRLEFDEVK
jgi:hypothetical protein